MKALKAARLNRKLDGTNGSGERQACLVALCPAAELAAPGAPELDARLLVSSASAPLAGSDTGGGPRERAAAAAAVAAGGQLAVVGTLDVYAARALAGEVLIGSSQNAAYLANVCSAPAARRRGVGTALLAAARDLARTWGEHNKGGACGRGGGGRPLSSRGGLPAGQHASRRGWAGGDTMLITSLLLPLPRTCRCGGAVCAHDGGERDRGAVLRSRGLCGGEGGEQQPGALPRPLPGRHRGPWPHRPAEGHAPARLSLPARAAAALGRRGSAAAASKLSPAFARCMFTPVSPAAHAYLYCYSVIVSTAMQAGSSCTMMRQQGRGGRTLRVLWCRRFALPPLWPAGILLLAPSQRAGRRSDVHQQRAGSSRGFR